MTLHYRMWRGLKKLNRMATNIRKWKLKTFEGKIESKVKINWKHFDKGNKYMTNFLLRYGVGLLKRTSEEV